MANIKSQKKRIRTNEKARMRNRAVKSELKTAIRWVREDVAAGDGAKAYADACKACRLLDKAVTKGVIPKRQAANRKSRIMKLVNTIVTDADRKAYEGSKPKATKTGNKKAARKEERAAEMAKASEEKAKRREKQLKEEAKAEKRKAKEAEEAAAAEAAAAEEAEAAEENADAEAAAEEVAQEDAAAAEEAAEAEAAAEEAEGKAEEAEVVAEAEEEAAE